MDIVVSDAEVDLLETRFLRNKSSQVVASLFSQATGVKDESELDDAFEIEDRVA